KLETDRIDIWHYGSLTHKPDAIIRTHEGALRHLLINTPPLKKSDDDTEKKKATTTHPHPPKPAQKPKPALPTTEEYDRLMNEGKLKEAVINDFEGKYGPDLTNDSLGFYLNALKNRVPHNLQILAHEGDNYPLIYDENHLIDWAKDANTEFDLPLTQAMSNNQSNQIYIPIRTPGHFELIVIDKERRQIIGYDPLGHFNASTDRGDILTKLHDRYNYKVISDKEMINGAHQEDSVRCGLYVIKFILEMINGASARDIFRLGHDQIDIEKTRRDVLELLRAS
ncbi:MAG: Ulp1 family isopeptidase, partial [Chlamydiota bacterium]